ncbi:unnamed protein product [Mytilus edulis]|uniref:Uncharacterized protein n=1 Tax=Mytilus edulis TaxID=6550 RepID=A0A8S3SBP1_MYTED|nr:unnamed protein product [Mytilus edulis]
MSTPLNRVTLYNILNVKRRNHGLVNITADGHSGFEHQTFVHILENASKQDWIAVAGFIKHIQSKGRVRMGHITEVYQNKRYDYSEAQSGKFYCDAKIAHLRQKIRILPLLTRTEQKVDRTLRIADAYIDDDNIIDILNNIEMDHVIEQIS